MVRADSDAAERAVSRFLNRLLALALLCFAMASHYGVRPAGTAQSDALLTQKPAQRADDVKSDLSLVLQKGAEAPLAKAAAEHCLADAHGCLALLQRLADHAARDPGKKRLVDEGRATKD